MVKPMARRFAYAVAVASAIWLTYSWNRGPFEALGIGLVVFVLISSLASQVLTLSILRKNGGRI